MMTSKKFYRIIILLVLGYEASGCLLGGALLTIKPDGSVMNMPVDIMHGTFVDFRVPGIILFLLGMLNGGAFLAGLRRPGLNWKLTFSAFITLLGWFWIEIAIIRQLHWLHVMWGGPVIIAGIAASQLYPWKKEFKRRVLLGCGIVASLVYVAITLIVASLWPSYNSASQTISELSAIGAPTRFIWVTLSAPYTLLMIAF